MLLFWKPIRKASYLYLTSTQKQKVLNCIEPRLNTTLNTSGYGVSIYVVSGSPERLQMQLWVPNYSKESLIIIIKIIKSPKDIKFLNFRCFLLGICIPSYYVCDILTILVECTAFRGLTL